MRNSLTIFTFKYPYGSQETFLENEVPVLAKEFSKVKIVPLFGDEQKRNVPEDVEVLRPVFPARNTSIIFKILSPRVLREVKTFKPAKLKKMLKQALIISELKKFLCLNLSKFRDDVLYFYWGTNAVNVITSMNLPNKKVARFHRFDLYEEDEPGGEAQVLREELNSKLDLLVFIADHGLKYYVNKYPSVASYCKLSYLGTLDFGINPVSNNNVLQVVTCSNIIPVKRVNLLAEALCRVKEIKIAWTHFGSGPEELVAEVKETMSRSSENISFNFQGRKPNKEILEYYQKNSVSLFLNVSISEGLPVSIMEAASFGIPVLAVDCGGVSELVPKDYLLPIELSPELLSRRIIEFYQNDFSNVELRTDMRKIWEERFCAEKNFLNFAKELKNL